MEQEVKDLIEKIKSLDNKLTEEQIDEISTAVDDLNYAEKEAGE